ncbi:uncharacterized protein LOC141514480 isoform X1 [Macrotis lagotis]|uniref:uncharacterized protein LOC141514480 isoform X1 n=1 Tax=Macrotis lagotis TaxID=92651 RepID=UPI003D684BE1
MVLAKQKGPTPWPQATVGTMILIISLFLWPLVDPRKICLSLDPANRWWLLLLLAPVHHESPWHLACNVVGLWMTGRRLEQSVGTGLLLVLMSSATLFTGFLHLAFNLAKEVTLQERCRRADCALGFSGDVQLRELPCGESVVVPGRICGGQLLHPQGLLQRTLGRGPGGSGLPLGATTGPLSAWAPPKIRAPLDSSPAQPCKQPVQRSLTPNSASSFIFGTGEAGPGGVGRETQRRAAWPPKSWGSGSLLALFELGPGQDRPLPAPPRSRDPATLPHGPLTLFFTFWG